MILDLFVSIPLYHSFFCPSILGRWHSFECEICQEYSDEFLCTIMDYSKKHGAKKTLLKLIKGKLFKNDMLFAHNLEERQVLFVNKT